MGPAHRRPIDPTAKLSAFGPGQQRGPGHAGRKTAIFARRFRLRQTGGHGNGRHVVNVVLTPPTVKRSVIARRESDVPADWHYGIAYNAALKLCTILLHAEGFKQAKGAMAHSRTLNALTHSRGIAACG